MESINTFSEVELFAYYEKLLLPGLKTHATNNIVQTRAGFDSILKPLALLRTTLCCASEPYPFMYIENIYTVISNMPLDYFFSHYSFECLWVEETKVMRNAPWYKLFKKQLYTLHDSSIIIIQY